MRKSENFKSSIQKLYTLMQKNKYYTNEDFKAVINQVYNIYIKNGDMLPLLRCGNLKLSKNIIIWNMPAIITCKFACPQCYALKPERMYKNTRVMRLRNLFLILLCEHDYNFKRQLQKQLIILLQSHAAMFKNPILRIHESGDFFEAFYIKFWNDILLKLKQNKINIKTYTYSKIISQLDGCNVITSFINIDNKKYINYGNIEYIKKLEKLLKKENIKYGVCSYGHQDGIQCGINCTKCLKYKNMLFYKH